MTRTSACFTHFSLPHHFLSEQYIKPHKIPLETSSCPAHRSVDKGVLRPVEAEIKYLLCCSPVFKNRSVVCWIQK
jgi:hypothetical protein